MEGCHGMSLANEDWADKQYRGRQLVYHDAAVADHENTAHAESGRAFRDICVSC